MREHFNDGVEFARFLAHRFVTDKAPNSAAALTYTTLFAVVPMMTVMFSMLSLIPAFHGMGESIQTFIFRNFVPSAGEAVETYLKSFTTQARHLTWVGVVFLAVTAFTMLVTIEKAFNEIWRVRQPRRGVGRFLLYWAILSLGPLLLGAGFAVTTYITSLSLLHGPDALPGAETLLGLMPLAFSVAAFTLLYSAVPNARVPVRHALMGGVFTAVLFEAAKTLFGLYVKPVSRLPVDLRCLRHRAYLPAVDLSFLDDRSVRRGAGLQSLFFPSLAAALAAQADRPARRAEGVPPAPAARTVAAPDPLASCGLAVARG
ncbi:YihY family inner membrane protein [Pseudomonas aeruginosa]